MRLTLLNILFFSCLCFLNLFSQNLDKRHEHVEVTQGLESENFRLFFKKFSSDSIFQLNHVAFPFKYISLNLENVEDKIISLRNKEDWEFIKLDNELERLKRESLGKVSISFDNDSVTVLLEGIPTKIYIEFIFQKYIGSWKLVEWNVYD